MAMMEANERSRVVIIGGGFGGLEAAKALRKVPVDVTLIDRSNHHLFYLVGFKNRVFVLLQWIWAYVVFRRGARLITGRTAKVALRKRRSSPAEAA